MEIITWLISTKFILENKRKEFFESHQWLIRETVLTNIHKILACWANLWFITYKCEGCGELKYIFFTCKSRFCNSCSKPQSDLRISKIFSRLPRWILYQHLFFTIPEELRDFFKRHRKALYLLPKTASDSVCFFLKQDQKCIPWIIAVIHTFWAKLNWNPHVHCIITHWAFYLKDGTFKKWPYLPYKAIKTSRTKMLIKNLKERVSDNLSWASKIDETRFLNTFYEYHSKVTGEKTTWYVHFPKHPCGFEQIIGYVGRYLHRTAIAQSSILDFDWENITFNYEDKREKNWKKKIKELTCSAMEFIGLLVQHIPNKYFHMVYYYGIFANRIKSKFLKVIYETCPSPRIYPRPIRSFRARFQYRTGIDPLKCSCWGFFHLYKITIPGYPTKFYDSS
jgi:hypothetical protein